MKIFFLLFCSAWLGLTGFRPFTATTLSGLVTDSATKEPLIGATVKISKDHQLVKATITDVNGKYSLTVAPGAYEVEFNYTGYASQRIIAVQILDKPQNTLDASLSAGAVLNECVVTEYKQALIRKDEMATGAGYSSERITPRSKAESAKKAPKPKPAAKSVAPTAKTSPASSAAPAPPVMHVEERSIAPGDEKDRGETESPGADDVRIKGARSAATTYYLDGVRVADRAEGSVPVRDVEARMKIAPPAKELYADKPAEDKPEEPTPGIPEQPSPHAGLLTAGEWNDLHNWNTHWLDLLADGEINSYQTLYGFFPKNRFAVLLTNDQDFPVTDAVVQLQNAAGVLIWEARTDNTGKAELWAGLFNQKDSSGLRATAWVNGQKHDLGQPKPAREALNRYRIPVDCQSPKNVDIVWAVDATGSMGDEIEYLKTELLDVIDRAKSHNPELAFRMGTVFYRDQGDDYLTKSSGLSPDIARTVDFIGKQFAGGGGDYPEAVHTALEEAIFNQKWSESAIARICFLVLDASPHQSPEINASLQRSIREAARLGIRIVPVTASGIQKDTEFLMKFFGLATNGTYVFLTDHSGIGGKHIEPTTDEYKVELLNDLLVRLITEYTTIKTCSGQSAIRFEDPQAQPNQPQPVNWQALYYPNPASTQFTLDLPFEVQSVTIYDAEGQAVRKLEKPQAGLNTVIVSDLAPGFYTIRIIKEGRMQSGKIMIIRN